MASISISIDAAVVGSTLADAVHDAQGHVLLAPGTVVTAGVIASLRRRDVQSVTLLASEGSADRDAAILEEQARLRLQVLFRHTVREGLVNPLLHILPRYRTGETT
jgi:hypothetical protein